MKDQDKGSGLPGSKMLKANEGQGKSDAMKSPPRRENRGKTDKFLTAATTAKNAGKKHGRRKRREKDGRRKRKRAKERESNERSTNTPDI